jgi:hypothetical protein
MRSQSQGVDARGTPLDIPSGKGYYHLNISVADTHSHRTIDDAQVTMRVSDGVMHESKQLGAISANKVVSYGSFFRFESGNAYNITAEIRRPGVSPVVANFDFKAP